jgi:uncharacterized protein YjbI with pentapeptide repeats
MTTIPPAVPDKAELEREQLYLGNQKLRVETRKLEREAEPDRWWVKLVKNAVAVGGVVTVVATIFGIWDSYNKTIVDRERTRMADQRMRFEDAIKRLESPSTISKLVGVSVLSGYLSADDRMAHRQVLFTLAGLMATEKDFQTQAAVVDLLTAIPREGPVAQEDWSFFQHMLVSQSRALVAKGDLVRRRQFQAASPVAQEEQGAQTVGKLIALNVRKGVVPTYANYRGIYCTRCDFHGSVFPRGVDFTGAVLDHSTFNGAKLEAAVFDNAEIVGTTFVETDLRQARFRSLDESLVTGVASGGDERGLVGRTAYLDHIAEALTESAVISIRMPKFNCANLEGANFHGHALFPGVIGLRRVYAKGDEGKPGWYETVPPFFRERAKEQEKAEFAAVLAFPPTFYKANLKNVRLDETRFFTVGMAPDPADFMSSAHGIRVGEFEVWQGRIGEDAFAAESHNGDTASRNSSKEQQEATRRRNAMLRRFQRGVLAAFYSAELDHAALPNELSDYLKRSKPTLGDYQFFRRRPIAGTDPDLNCKLRPN